MTVSTRQSAADNPNPNINVQLDGPALDTFIPKIPKADHAAIKEKYSSIKSSLLWRANQHTNK